MEKNNTEKGVWINRTKSGKGFYIVHGGKVLIGSIKTLTDFCLQNKGASGLVVNGVLLMEKDMSRE